MNKKSKIINKFENRQIKFRVWNIKKKKYTYPEDNVYSIFWNPYLNRNEVVNGCEMHYDESTHISQQFTGLLDKNGKEIYEGDILEYIINSDYANAGRYIYVIEWDHAGFKAKEKSNFGEIFVGDKMRLYPGMEDGKIIGNIFENL